MQNSSTRYSIVYAVIRPEINEQLSVGIILQNEEMTMFRYSENKLHALRVLYTPKEYMFFEGLIKTLHEEPSITTPQGIAYLNRYSNNMLSISTPETIDIPLTADSSEWIFTQYIDRSLRTAPSLQG